MVKVGSTVTLFVSTGLKLATVPSLKGMTVERRDRRPDRTRA